MKLTVELSSGVAVDPSGGLPRLMLSDGAIATYDPTASDPGVGTLVFNYAVAASDRSSALAVLGLDLNGAIVRSAVGIDADMSGVSGAALDLAVNVAVVSGITSSAKIGDVETGQSIALTLALTEAVTVDTTAGTPTLALSGGGVASYDAGASNPATGTLLFDYAVGASDYTTDLAVAGLHLNGATIRDAAGVDADLSAATGFDLALDVNAAVVTGVTASQNGEVGAGAKVALTVTLNHGITIDTAAGTPDLSLDSGAVATYDAQASNPANGILVFDDTVAPGDRTPSLQAVLFDANGAVINDLNGKAADLSAVTDFDTGLQVGSVFVDHVTVAQSSAVNTGQTVQITVAMSEGVTVDTTNGAPTLSLSDGAVATYDAAASSPADGTLVFDDTVAAGDYTTDLTVAGAGTNGAVIADSHGVAADLAGAAGADLALDVNAAVVTGMTASPGGGEVHAGDHVTLTVTLDSSVSVQTAGASPTLGLIGGGIASYDPQKSKPFAGILVFDYTVGAADRASRLVAAEFNANGSAIIDASGHAADVSSVSAFATNLQVGPAFVTSVQASQTGEIAAAQAMQLTVSMSDAVTVDLSGGMPTLSLSDGATGTYDAAASNPFAGTLVFDYTVGAGDYAADLKVTSLNPNGAIVRDRNGVDADLSGAAASDLFVGVNAVTVTDLSVSPVTGEAVAGQTLTLTVSLSDAVTVATTAGSPVLVLDSGEVATYDAQASHPSAGILVFDYTVGATDEAADLQGSLDLNGSMITDARGNAPDFSGLFNIATGVQVGPAFVDGATAAQSGDVRTGDTVQITVGASGPVTVDTTGGAPTLKLSDGAVATYDAAASDPSQGSLVFDYTVGAAEFATDLSISALNRNGAAIKDRNGADFDRTGAAGADLGLHVNVPISTGLTSAPQSGEVAVGQKIQLALTLSEGVSVGLAGQPPTLTLSDGGVATYDAAASNPSAGTLVFDHTVGPTNQALALFATKVNLNGATIANAAGHAADFSGILDFVTDMQVGAGPLLISDEANGLPLGQTLDLGTATLAQGKQSILDLRNLGTVDMVLNGISVTDPSHAFAVLPISPGTVIAPGAAIPVTLTFTPNAVGAASAQLVIDSNDPSGPTSLALTGFGRGVAQGAAVTLTGNNDLGGATVGSGSVQQDDIFTITNNGAAPLVVSAIQLAAGAGDFSLDGVPADIATNPVTLAFGQSFSFGAVFHPKNAGLDRAVISIATNDPAQPTTQVDVVGTGLSSATPLHWGDDYVMLDTGSGPELTKSDQAGNFQYFMPANSPYHLAIFDPVSGQIAHEYGSTGPSGTNLNLTQNLAFTASQIQDSDYDGLPDDVETTIGTDPNKADSVVPGLSDLAALQQGLVSNKNLATTTGVVASLALRGQAQAIVLTGSPNQVGGQIAYIATGGFGLAIVDVSRFQKPVLLGQLALAGNATDVAVDTSLGFAAVATGIGGLQIVDVANSTRPAAVQVIAIDATQVEIIDGIAYANDGGKIDAFDLATGQQLGSLALGSAAITALAHDGTILYAVDAGNRLTTLDTANGSLVQKGAVVLPFGGFTGDRLFVAQGIAYVGTAQANGNGGYLTVDVADPAAPKLIEGPDAQNIAGAAIALNGSGLGVSVQRIQVLQGNQPGQQNAIDVVDASDPTKTGNFITRFLLPGQPNDVAIGEGVAFVADGEAGLQVVNYEPFDTKGVRPTIALTQLPTDQDPNTPGIQVAEGQTVTLGATIKDDVQVRNVEVLVNGVAATNSLSYPFDLSAPLPTIAANGSNQVTLQVEAFDTGGNIALSDPVQVTLLADTTPPALVSQSVTEGAVKSQNLRTLVLQFSKPLDPATVTAANFTLLSLAGPVVPQSIQTRDNGAVVQLTYATLDPGAYAFELFAPNITDRAGNALGAQTLTTHFTVAPFTARWNNPLGGDWSNAANWLSGQVPGPADEVLIDVAPGVRVTVSSGVPAVAGVTLRGGGTLTVAGGAFTVATLAVTGDLGIDHSIVELDAGGTIETATISNDGGSFISAGGTLDNVTFRGTIDLSADGAALNLRDGITLIGASGAGPGTINFTGARGALDILGVTVLDDAVLNVGNVATDRMQAGSLTLGPRFTLNQVGTLVNGEPRSDVVITANPPPGPFIPAVPLVLTNQGIFNAGFAGGSLTIGDAGLIGSPSLKDQNSAVLNQGTMAASNGDSLAIVTSNLTNAATGTLSATDGGTLAIDAFTWSNAGTIVESNGTLNLGGNFTLASIGNLSRTGGTINITGTLNNTGTTLEVGSGTSLGTLAVQGGTINGGTIHDHGLGLVAPLPPGSSGLIGNGATLDGVTYQGTLDLGGTPSEFIVKNGITLVDAAGTGPGKAVLGLGALDFAGTQTVDNAEIDFGGSFGGLFLDEIDGAAHTLTFGPNLVINVGGIGGLGDGLIAERFAEGGKIVNKGAINAASGHLSVAGTGDPSIGIPSTDFTNDGTVTVASGAQIEIQGIQTLANTAGATLSAINGGTLTLQAADFTNAGTMVENGGTLTFNVDLSQSRLGTLVRSGGAVNLMRTYDNTGTVLNVGTGSALGTLNLVDGPLSFSTQHPVSMGTIRNGTIHDGGTGLTFDHGILDGVAYQGTLDLSAPASLLYIKNGITLNDLGGTGPGRVAVTGAASAIFAEGTETLDNATIDLGSNLGNSTGAASIFNVANNGLLSDPVAADAVLTLGPNLTINHAADFATLDSKGFSIDTPGAGIVNRGTINAALNGGTFSIDLPRSVFAATRPSFTNFGKIIVANGDALNIGTFGTVVGDPSTGNFTNFSAGTLAGGTYVISGASTLTIPQDEVVTTLAADVTLDGAGAALRSLQSATSTFAGIDTTLSSIAAGGAFRLLGRRNANEAQALLDAGLLQLGGGIFGTTALNVASTGNVLGFGTIAAPLANDGLVEAQNNVLEVTGAVSGTGNVQIDAGATLELDSAVGSSESVTFAAGSGTLLIGAPARFAATIAGFSAGAVIDLAGVAGTAATFQSGILTITNGGITVATLVLAGTFPPNTNFQVTSDGNGGSLITIGSAPKVADSIWTAGVSGDWGIAANWNPAGVPNSPATTAAITVPGTYTVTIAANESFSIGTLTMNNATATLGVAGTLNLAGTLALKGGTVQVSGGTIVGGTIEDSGGTLTGSGGTNNGGVLSGGTLNGVTLHGALDLSALNAAMTVKNGFTTAGVGGIGVGQITLTGSGAHLVAQGIETFDNVNIDIGGSGRLFIDGSAGPGALTLGAHATVNHVSSVAQFFGLGLGTSLVNLGTMNLGANGGTVGLFGGTDFTNQGVINVSNGDTVQTVGLASFTNAASGRVTVANGGNFTLSAPGWTNAGTINVNGGNLNLDSTFTLARLGTVTRSGGAIKVVGTLDNTGTTFNVSAGSALGTVVLLSTGTIRNGTINDDGTGLSISSVSAIPTLDGVTYQGTLNVAGAAVNIKNGITFAGLNGIGKGTVNLADGSLMLQASTVLDNATLNIRTGANFRNDSITALSQAGVIPTLTLGANLIIDHSGVTSESLFLSGMNLVNLGTINANSLSHNAFIDTTQVNSFINQGAVNVSNGDTFIVGGQSWSNLGTMSVTSGTLSLRSAFTTAQLGTIIHTGGTIALDSGSVLGLLDNTGATLNVGAGTALGTLTVNSAAIKNGIIHDAGSGLLLTSNSTTLDGVTYQGILNLNAAGRQVTIKNGITLTDAAGTGPGTVDMTDFSFFKVLGNTTLDNAVINIGTNSPGTGDSLVNTSDDTTTAVLTLGANLTINHSARSATLTGDFRAGSGIVNAGIVNAGNNGGTFTISSHGFDNHGLVHSFNNDLVSITSTTVSNSGKLWADGGKFVLTTALAGTGSEEITGSGSIEFNDAVAASQTVTFDAGSTGTLRLDNSSAFAGTVAGLALGNFVDFADITFGTATTLDYVANADNSGGTLKLSDGTHAASIALLGSYTVGNFVKSSDGNGGTRVTDPPLVADHAGSRAAVEDDPPTIWDVDRRTSTIEASTLAPTAMGTGASDVGRAGVPGLLWENAAGPGDQPVGGSSIWPVGSPQSGGDAAGLTCGTADTNITRSLVFEAEPSLSGASGLGASSLMVAESTTLPPRTLVAPSG